jgi:hypothetical protein
MALTEFEFIHGLTCLIIVVVFAIISMIIVSKYFKSKERIYILFGLSWFFLVEVWFSASIAFLMIIIAGRNYLTFEWFAIIAIVGYPFTLIVWIMALTDLFWKKRQKILLLIFFIFGIIIEFFFLYFLFTEPTIIGEPFGRSDVTYGLFISVYFIFLMFFFIITGLLFARQSLQSDNPEIRLRGKLLIVAFLSFLIGAFVDNLPNYSTLIILIARIPLIIAAIFFYLAFILPNWLKKLFLE